MLGILRKNFLVQFSAFLFVVLTAWWITMYARGLKEGIENNIYTCVYPLLSLLGGVAGLIAASKWGSFKSVLGTSITFFSFGLLAQFFGQVMYAYYIYIQNIEVPYPSWGDLGYFGSVIFYIIAVLLLARVVAVRVNLKSIGGKAQAVLLPLILLTGSYLFFLQGYVFDWTQPLKIFLDFAYPLGQAFYLSIALLVFLLSRDILGGMMKGPMRFVLFALIVQYFCDFMFLYQASRGTWYVGGLNDFLYSCSYFVMTLALAYISGMFERIRNS